MFVISGPGDHGVGKSVHDHRDTQPEVLGLISALSTGTSSDTTIYVASCNGVTNGTSSDCRLQQFPVSEVGSIAASWTVPTHGGINALLYESGALYAAGRFMAIAEQPRVGVAKLVSAVDGMVDANWIAERSPRVAYSLASVGDGEIIVSGSARTTGSRPALIRLGAESGTENLAWRPWQSFSEPYAAGAMAVLPDRNLYFANSGYICCVQRTPTTGLVDGAESNWTLNIDGRVDAMVGGGAGELIVAGTFWQVDGIARSGLARLTDVHPVLFVDQFE